MLLNEDYIFNKILESTYTLAKIKKRVRAIKLIYTEQLFGGEKKTYPEVSKEELEWFKTLPYDFAQNFPKENFNEVFALLESQIEKETPLTVYLAFEPAEKEIEVMGKFVRENFSEGLLMDIKLDPTLIGGCAFIWKGIYKDYSLKSQMAANRQKIMEEFKGFLKG